MLIVAYLSHKKLINWGIFEDNKRI